jgi:glycosyltransferase involved in cell wall biosynthesis
MKVARIVAQCLIKNEERFIWYALNSVLPFVDQIMVWDTGSTDDTIKIIHQITSPKINIQLKKSVSPEAFSHLRQQMLEEIPKGYDWLMILDGDEIWPQKSLWQIKHFINLHPDFETVVVKTNNLTGDIYHRLPESTGKYRFKNQIGHLSLRFINLSIPGLKVDKPYGHEGYFDENNLPIQNRDPHKMEILNLYYHHATGLRRSSRDTDVMQRSGKRKYELGEIIAEDQIPEIFFVPKSTIVPNVTSPMGSIEIFIGRLLNPLYLLKRKYDR